MVEYFLMWILLPASGSENAAAASLLLSYSYSDVSVCSGSVKEVHMTQKYSENRYS